VIVRLQSDAIPQQSRAATGVRLQKLDSGDRLTEVVLVPPSAEEEEVVDVEAVETAVVDVTETAVIAKADPEVDPEAVPETDPQA